jgi:Domain of unknown function (DUF4157)
MTRATPFAAAQRTASAGPIPASPIRASRQARNAHSRLESMQSSLGNQGMLKLISGGVLQRKLTINQPGDAYEQEADRVAETVMRTPSPPATRARVTATGPAAGLQRCSCGKSAGGSEQCEECKTQSMHRKENVVGSQATGSSGALAPSIVHDVLRSPGRPLDAATRSFMEPRFGRDLSGVRIHTDPRAAESARAVNALAYTVGEHIAFDSAQDSLESYAGKQTLAHELAHVIHQSKGQRLLQRLIRTSEVHCTAADAGVANPNPFSADRRASTLLDNAIQIIDRAQAARVANPADPDVVAVGNALHTAFRLDPASNDTWTLGPPNVRLPVIRRRVQAVKEYIDSVVFTVHCFPVGGGPGAMPCGTCPANGREAYTCPGDVTDIALCPPFWADNLNQRARALAHEVFHITFGFINDWGSPDVHNAHCYAQFVALLNGFNSPAGFRCH